MKRLTKLSVLLLCMAMPLLFISCNNEGEKTESTTGGTTAAAPETSKHHCYHSSTYDDGKA